MNTAEWDIQAHDAKAGPLVVMGALGGIPAGLGVVEDGPLPYRPEALAKKKENEANWLALDPVVKCFLPGLPRATYMPFPFEIVLSIACKSVDNHGDGRETNGHGTSGDAKWWKHLLPEVLSDAKPGH